MTCSSRVISPVSSPISCRSEATLPAYGCGRSQAVQPRLPVHAEDVRMQVTGMPSLASTACTWSLARGAEPDQLVPVPGQLAQLADLRRGDPRLRQPAHPQQVGQVRGVALIVLDPAVGERLDPQRMRQVHLRPGLLEHVRGPVPAVRRLDHHPRVLPRPGDHRPQRRGAVGDPDGLQLPAVLGHPHQHAAPPVQVHPDDLPAVICFRHRGPPVPWWRRMLRNFQHPPGAEARSFIASREVTLDPGASAGTPVRRQGPGRSLPGPDAGHPLQGAGRLAAGRPADS